MILLTLLSFSATTVSIGLYRVLPVVKFARTISNKQPSTGTPFLSFKNLNEMFIVSECGVVVSLFSFNICFERGRHAK